MVQVIDLDQAILRPENVNFWIDQDDTSTGPGLDGREQTLFTENRRWIGQLDFVRMRPAALAQAEVLGDRLRGRASILRVHLCNRRTLRYQGDDAAFFAAAGVTDADLLRGYVPFSDGTTFDDGSGFALGTTAEPTLGSAAVAGASQVQMDGLLGQRLAFSAFFSINDFLHRVWQNESGLVKFNPPLRESYQAGTVVDVSAPKVRVKLQSKSDWRPFCEYFRHGRPMTVNVTEAFER